jgi:hypothetical protein
MSQSSKWTPRAVEGPLAVDFKVQDNVLIKRTVQADRGIILRDVQAQRESDHKQRILGGWKVATIPLVDLPKVEAKYPELFASNADADLKARTLVKFSQDAEFRHLIVQGA